MTEAVGYMRCSGASQVDGDTWDRQLEAIKSCCVSKEINLIHEYRDEAVPGKLGEESRPGFQQMVSDLLSNGCRTIVIEGLDRLARQYDIQQQLATYLASKGIALISANTGEDITAALMGDPMRRALVQIQGIFAELDKNLLIAKLRKARDRKKKLTGKGTGRHAFGEKPGEEFVLVGIQERRASGMTSSQIADDLNSGGIPTRMGGMWKASTVAKILRRQVKRDRLRQ
jgi:site-specific DNA recombinase